MLRRTLLIITLVKPFTRYKYTSQESLINSLKVVCHGHFFFNECLISTTKILEIFSQRSLKPPYLGYFYLNWVILLVRGSVNLEYERMYLSRTIVVHLAEDCIDIF